MGTLFGTYVFIHLSNKSLFRQFVNRHETKTRIKNNIKKNKNGPNTGSDKKKNNSSYVNKEFHRMYIFTFFFIFQISNKIHDNYYLKYMFSINPRGKVNKRE